MRRNRAVSTALDYTMTLAIASILVTGLLFASSNFVDDRREEVVRDELNVIGHQVASDLSRADRLVTAADSNGTDLTVGVNQTFPERVAGSTYHVSVDQSNEQLVLKSTNGDVRVTIGLELQTALGESSAQGGIVRVVYTDIDGDGDYELEVRNG